MIVILVYSEKQFKLKRLIAWSYCQQHSAKLVLLSQVSNCSCGLCHRFVIVLFRPTQTQSHEDAHERRKKKRS